MSRQKYYILSSFFIEQKFIKWIVGIILLLDLFVVTYLPDELKTGIKQAVIFSYTILFIWNSFYLLFKSLSLQDLRYDIENLDEIKSEINKIKNLNKKESLVYYENILKSASSEKKYIHIIKTIDEIADLSNILPYIIILTILWIGRFSFDYINPLGTILFLLMTSIVIIFCLVIIFYCFMNRKHKYNDRKNLITIIIITHIIIIYFVFNWGKNLFVINYGNETLGSYFEKPEYRTKYYVNLYQNADNIRYEHMPAIIHVFLEYEEGYDANNDTDETYTAKKIIIEKIYLPDGNYLEFEDCQFEYGEKAFCTDNYGEDWDIELTNHKVE